MSANVPEIPESRLSEQRRTTWIALHDVLRRLRFSRTSAESMVKELRKGLRVRFAPKACLDVIISETEARALLRGKSIRKLEVLVEAARSSTEWVDVANLPPVIVTREWNSWLEDTEHGWVEFPCRR